MSLTVSPAVKIFALVGLLATVALAGAFMFLGQPSDDATAESTLLVAAPAKATDVAAKASAAVRKPTSVAKPEAKAKPAAKPAPKPKPAAKPKPVRVAPVSANGMPSALMSALARDHAVVMALYSSASKIDGIALEEARAGAAAAGAGFMVLDVNRDQRAAEALTLKLGTVLRTPTVLIFSRPDVLKVQLDGYRDRETVAQAAQNASR